MEKLGRVPLCNGKAERAPHIGKFCFPLCWRCTSIIAGILIANLMDDYIEMSNQIVGLIVAALLIAPCLIDGLRQKLLNYESTNVKRAITGLIAGIGIHFITISAIALVSVQ